MRGWVIRVCLYQPDIAGNVGTVLRLAACLGVGVDIVEPCGFAFGDRSLRRAGLDYAARADIRRHSGWDAFRDTTPGRPVLLTTDGDVRLDAARFAPGDILVMGSEAAGVPAHVHAAAALRVRIPMRAGYRSLNVAVAAGIALAEALRQLHAWPGDAVPPATEGMR